VPRAAPRRARLAHGSHPTNARRSDSFAGAASRAGLGPQRCAGHRRRRRLWGRIPGRRGAGHAGLPGAGGRALRRGVAAPPGAQGRRRQCADRAPRRGRGDAARRLPAAPRRRRSRSGRTHAGRVARARSLRTGGGSSSKWTMPCARRSPRCNSSPPRPRPLRSRPRRRRGSWSNIKGGFCPCYSRFNISTRLKGNCGIPQRITFTSSVTIVSGNLGLLSISVYRCSYLTSSQISVTQVSDEPSLLPTIVHVPCDDIACSNASVALIRSPWLSRTLPKLLKALVSPRRSLSRLESASCCSKRRNQQVSSGSRRWGCLFRPRMTGLYIRSARLKGL
jgi:hypothetical protein